MKMSNNLKMILMVGVASIALAGCSDTDISSPGTVIAPPAAPPPPPPPSGPDPIDLVPDSFDASISNNLNIETRTFNGQEIEVVAVRGIVTSDLTLEAGVGYFLDNTVFVGQDAGSGATSGTGVTLTIEPGATIYGAGDFSGLVVARGSQINADGTKANPIVFSSINELQREEGSLDAPTTGEARAEWLGLVLNGFAPINNCNDAATPGSADCQDDGEASSGLYGGGDAADNSGILNYVRVEFAGVFYTEEDQSNGIAFQGVGSGTQVSNIQVHNNGDDGVEFFGGTVSATNVVITGAADDAIDWTDGWTGSLQRALVIQSSDDGDYAIEADNRSVSAADRTPRSNPKIANFTFIGNGGTNGIRLREGTAVTLGNGIVTNFATGIRFDDEPTVNLFQVGPGADGKEILISGNLFNATNTSRDSVNDQGTEDTADDVVVFTAAQNVATLVNSGNAVNVDEIAAPFNFVPGPNASVAAQRDEFGNPLFLGSDGNTYAAGDTVPAGVTLTALTEVQVLGTAVAQVSDLADPGDLVQLDYIGAFAPEETVEDNWAAGWTRPGSVFDDVDPIAESCPTSPRIEASGTIGDSLVCTVSGTITENLTLPQFDNVLYRLDGQVFVGADGGGAATPGIDPVVLTIEPGVTVFGESARDGLVVSRGNQINAAGTADAPIVFTSGQAIRGVADYEADSAQWLGLSINGRAPINTCADADLGTANCEDDGEGNAGLYGGNVADDNSGTLQYVRVEFAGIFLSEEDQSNGIQFLGTGSGTTIDHIQVHNNGDDGIEFFGGTASGKYFVITGARDDSFDWTDGWQGNVQYLLIEQFDSDYAFEGDNRSESDPNRAPISTPQIANFTIIGAGAGRGARFREGMNGTFVNGIWAETTTGIDIDDDFAIPGGSIDNLQAGTLVIDTHFIDSPVPVVDDAGEELTGAEIEALLLNITKGTNDMGGFSFFGRAGIGVEPSTTEAGVTAFDSSTIDAGFFEDAGFIGAVNPAGDDWYLGWTVDSTGAVTSTN